MAGTPDAARRELPLALFLADVAGGLAVAWLAIAASDRILGRIHRNWHILDG